MSKHLSNNAILYNDGDRERHPEGRRFASEKTGGLGRDPFRQDVVNLSRSSEFRRLEGKTQLFPECESDLFRDRLTHTLEVAQIARDICRVVNDHEAFRVGPDDGGIGQVSPDVVEFAALAHDIGHPPFGHVGEKALDKFMLQHGGFEGNAQTLRTVSRLIKRSYDKTYLENPSSLIDPEGNDLRLGLNLCYRSVLAVLKYDKEIEGERDQKEGLKKGYYSTERELVRRAKDAVFGVGNWSEKEETRTLECSIMDTADDIAYSTSDIEDAFKSSMLRITDFLHPRDQILRAIRADINFPEDNESFRKIRKALRSFAHGLLRFLNSPLGGYKIGSEEGTITTETESRILSAGENLEQTSHLRNEFFGWWIDQIISSVEIRVDNDLPSKSEVVLKSDVAEHVKILKSFVFQSVTLSAPIQHVAFKGELVVGKLCEAIEEYQTRLLPRFERGLLKELDGLSKEKIKAHKNLYRRIICDYVAGMTDRHALALYDQLNSGRLHPLLNPFHDGL